MSTVGNPAPCADVEFQLDASPAHRMESATDLSHSRTIAMPLSGEAIRLMNYIDDVAVTLRRVLSFVPTLSAEERLRLSEHLQNSRPNAEDVQAALAAK